jgi:hypothetical protein
MLKTIRLRRGATILVAAFVAASAGQAAFAVPKEQGTYDCSCKGGKGSCTYKSNGSEISCYRGYADTCEATCQLSTSPVPGGGITRGSVTGGPIGSGGSAATH